MVSVRPFKNDRRQVLLLPSDGKSTRGPAEFVEAQLTPPPRTHSTRENEQQVFTLAHPSLLEAVKVWGSVSQTVVRRPELVPRKNTSSHGHVCEFMKRRRNREKNFMLYRNLFIRVLL